MFLIEACKDRQTLPASDSARENGNESVLAGEERERRDEREICKHCFYRMSFPMSRICNP
jgi:hypothetical protein